MNNEKRETIRKTLEKLSSMSKDELERATEAARISEVCKLLDSTLNERINEAFMDVMVYGEGKILITEDDLYTENEEE